MPTIKVNITQLGSYESDIQDILSRINSIQSQFDTVSRNLDWDIKAESGINSCLTGISQDLSIESRGLSGMKSFLGLARGKYDEVERKNLGNDLKNETVGSGANIRGSVQIGSASNIRRVEAGGNAAWLELNSFNSTKTGNIITGKTSNSTKSNATNPTTMFLKKIGKSGLNILEEAGVMGKAGSFLISLLKIIFDGDEPNWEDVGSAIKSMGNSIVGLCEMNAKTGGEWPISTKYIKELVGLEKYNPIHAASAHAGWFERLKCGETSFVNAFKEKLSPGLKNIRDAKTADQVQTGSTVAGWALSFIANGFSNYNEFGRFTGRMAAETVTETIIDIGKDAAIVAGVAAGCAVIGVAAPAVVVGGIGVVTSAVADIVCENYTGKSVTELASDTILDNLTEAGRKVTGAVSTAKKAVSGWFNRVTSVVSRPNVQYYSGG